MSGEVERRLPGWVFVLLLAAVLATVGYLIVSVAQARPAPVVLEPEPERK
jgi:hypothetical protein